MARTSYILTHWWDVCFVLDQDTEFEIWLVVCC